MSYFLKHNFCSGTKGYHLLSTSPAGSLTSGQATGSTNITAPTTEGDMTDMSVTLTTYGTKLLVMFQAPFYSTSARYIKLYINIDGSDKTMTQGYNVLNSTYSGPWPMSFQWLESGLTPGSHTVKIRWYSNSGTNAQQRGSTDGVRVLTVQDLY